MEAASSGEVSLLASHVFIATHIKDRSYILIDEPENSLHPRWQAEFCKNFMDQFYYFEPKLLIATHSPHVVHGAQMEIGAEVVKLPFNQNTDEPLTNSIEGILFEAFGVLSPASHYLSEKVTYLLNEMTQNRVSFDSVISQLQRLKSISWDAKQKEFLEKAELLTKEVFQANTRVEN